MKKMIKERVREILIENPIARNSDDSLIWIYTKKYGRAGMNIRAFGISFAEMKTIERYRRKLQAENDRYRADEDVIQYREDQRKEYQREMKK